MTDFSTTTTTLDTTTTVEPDVYEASDIRADTKQQRDEAQAMLRDLGYSPDAVSAELWRELVEQAYGCLFLRSEDNWKVDGQPIEHDLVHRVCFANESLAGLFLHTLDRKFSHHSDVWVTKPVEMLEDHEVEVCERVLMTPEALTKACCDIVISARVYLGRYEGWSRPLNSKMRDDVTSMNTLQAWEHRPSKRLRMRFEFQTDVVVARVALAPYVCRWTDVDSEALDGFGASRQATTLLGHDVEFELTDLSFTLDELRWMLNQIPDMHVAAQSLNYEHLYTGERLSYTYLQRMQPSDETVVKMAQMSVRVAEFLKSVSNRVECMKDTLKVYAPIGSLTDEESDDDDYESGDDLATE